MGCVCGIGWLRARRTHKVIGYGASVALAITVGFVVFTAVHALTTTFPDDFLVRLVARGNYEHPP